MTPTQTAITANIAALSSLLTEASAIAAEASEAASAGRITEAVGGLALIERSAGEATALLAAALALHRLNRS
jgi:uncharacterized protein YdbL (DUF1318 family)